MTEPQITVAVLFGGRSSEYEISLKSAVYVLKNMPEKYRILLVGISRQGGWFTPQNFFMSHQLSNISVEDLHSISQGFCCSLFPDSKIKPSVILPYPLQALNSFSFSNTALHVLNNEVDCFFPVMHGRNGEDGRLQALFELADLAYVGCDLTASAIGMDKDIQKRLARDAGVSVAQYALIHFEEFEKQSQDCLLRIRDHIGFPCFVKPNSSGSAVGANKAETQEQLILALKEAFSFGSKVLVEELIVGSEIECCFLGTEYDSRISTPGEIVTENFYSYEEKYSSSSKASLFIPSRLSPERENELKSTAKCVAKSLGVEGLCRIDFWNTSSGRFIFNEINTIPGLTAISMFPKLWDYDGIPGPVWIESVIFHALKRKNYAEQMCYGVHSESLPVG